MKPGRKPGDILVRKAMPKLLDAMWKTSVGVWTVRLTCPDGIVRTFRTSTAVQRREGFGPGVRFAVLTRDGYRCRYCGATGSDVPLHVDHVVPVIAGGPDEMDNLVTACQDCNLGKSAGTAATIVANGEALSVG